MDPSIISRSTGTATSSALTQVTPSLPRDAQSLSRLMQLPAEVRLMILRHLLVQSTPIASRESYSHPYLIHNKGRERDGRGRFVKQTRNGTVSGYHFTPSIIGTCQVLSNEALPLLYHYNTLQVHIVLDALCRHPSYRAKPLGWNGVFNIRDATARVHICDHVFALDRLGGHLSLRDGSKRMALQFKNILIKIEVHDPCTLTLAHLRGSLKQIAPSFSKKNIEVKILQDPQNSQAYSSKQLFQLIKAFEVLRCSSFRFTDLSGPTAIATQNVITSNAPVIELEEFMRLPGELVQKAIDNPGSGHAKINKCLELRSRLVDAIGDIDVVSFLHVRLEILRMWRSFMEKVNTFKLEVDLNGGDRSHDGGEDLEYYFRSVAISDFTYHFYDSPNLGLETYEDGSYMNAKLRDLARRYNFSPINVADTSN